MRTIYFIVFPLTSIVSLVFLYIQFRKYKNDKKDSLDDLYTIKTGNIRLRYETCKIKYDLKEFPIFNKRIESLLALEYNGCIKTDSVKLKGNKICDSKPFKEALKLKDELDSMQQKEFIDLVKLYFDTSEILTELAERLFPFRYKINRLKGRISLLVLVFSLAFHKDHSDATPKTKGLENEEEFVGVTLRRVAC